MDILNISRLSFSEPPRGLRQWGLSRLEHHHCMQGVRDSLQYGLAIISRLPKFSGLMRKRATSKGLYLLTDVCFLAQHLTKIVEPSWACESPLPPHAQLACMLLVCVFNFVQETCIQPKGAGRLQVLPWAFPWAGAQLDVLTPLFQNLMPHVMHLESEQGAKIHLRAGSEHTYCDFLWQEWANLPSR